MEAKIPVDRGQPQVLPSSSCFICTDQKVDQELQRLEQQGIIEPVQSSGWAAPIVPVMKKESVRICGDFKLTVNPVAKDSFPLPRIEDLFATLAGGKAFTDLSASSFGGEFKEVCYHQYSSWPLPLQQASFWCFISAISISDNNGQLVYVDDILVMGTTTDEHLRNLKATLQRN